jgi:non-haem Fe2+, alpha-ketoglutarate-dependent halogenase
MPDGVATPWIEHYHREGYYAPIRVLSTDEARACRAHLEAWEAKRGPLPDELRHRAHVFLVWLDELVRNPRILDAVEAILGENLLVWSSSFFIKEGADGTYVPWHQDSRAYGARAPDVVTAWVALTDSTPENGALQVIPRSHARDELVHTTQHISNSLLTRRREVALGVDVSVVTIVPLQAGEMSLHHSSLVHGSPSNRTADRRIGIAIRYVRPAVGGMIGRREPALLVRGADAGGSFEPLPRPERDSAPEGLARHAELMHPPEHHTVVRLYAEVWARAVTLRGALLVRDGKGLILCGPPGSGKSTLTAALARRGWTCEAGEGGSDLEARHAAINPHHEAPPRVNLAGILLLARAPATRDGTLVAIPAAHALLALLPYRRCADPAGLAQGIHDLEPLVNATPVYEGASGSDGMADAVERLADGSPAESPGTQRSATVWAEVDETAGSPSALRAGHDMEHVHE